MPNDEIMTYIDHAIHNTIAELKKSGVLIDPKNVAYSEASEILKTFFQGNKEDATINYALQTLRFDPYFRILPMYFEQGKTIEAIAEAFEVDVSTIVRNKKRLCIAFYNEIG